MPNLQAAVLSTASFMLCWKALGLVNPIFAPIVTYLCMGFTRNRQPRKVIEFGLGATAGVLLGAVVTHLFGFGWWQMFILLFLGPLIGRFIDRSDVVTFQTGINAIVLAAMISINAQAEQYSVIERLVPALIGALVALIATILIPSNLVSRPRRYIGFAIGETARVLRRLSHGLRDGDFAEISRLRGLIAGIREVLTDADQSLKSAEETATIKLRNSKVRAELRELRRLFDLTERMFVTVSMLQRQSRGMVSEIGSLPELSRVLGEISGLLDEVSEGVHSWERPTTARDKAVEIAGELNPMAFAAHAQDWRSSTLVALTRALVVDLLELAGLSMAQARSALVDIADFDPTVEADTTAMEMPSVAWGTEQFPAVVDPAEIADQNSDQD